jgi:hypothetical protein
VALGTITVAQSVTYDFDRSANFSAFRTYAWVRGTRLDDELNHQRIIRAIDAQLTLKGLAKVDLGSRPDLLVAYHATFDRDLQINAFSSVGDRIASAGTSQVARGPKRSRSAPSLWT